MLVEAVIDTAAAANASAVDGRVAVVIDVLRASTTIATALAAGADGYLVKDCTPEELLADLKRIAGLMRQRRA